MSWHILWTILLLIMFVGIVMWAFSARRKTDFEQASRVPLEDDVIVSGLESQSRDGGEIK